MRRVYLVDLLVRRFRNLASDRVCWNRSANLVTGANGQGKTNLLEAVTVLGNLRSFRTTSMRPVVAAGEQECVLEGTVATRSGPVRLTQHVTLGPPLGRELTVAGASASVQQYLGVLPIVAISAADRELVMGGPGGRRAFLDRFAFLIEPELFDELKDYRRVLKQRNAALVVTDDETQMAVWEERLAAAAARVVGRRLRACRRLSVSFEPVYGALRSDGFPDVAVQYRGEAGFEQAENVPELEEYYRKRYNETRARDRRTGFTVEGPHRHDLGLRADGRTVRHMLSSGQSKVVAAALRLASLKQIELDRGEQLPVIIDDVDSELDRVVLGRLIGHLGGNRQLFLSSADGGVFRELSEGSSRFEIRRGSVIDAAGERTDD